jgi:carboxyl-terminal processing protease
MDDSSVIEGNNLEHSVEKDSSKPVYHTHSGRIVYGGGGITPDYIVKNERITTYTSDLLRQNVFYQFILSYIESNGKEITKNFGNDLKKFNNEFKFSDAEMKIFVAFASSKEVTFNEKEFNTDKDYIKTRLKAQLARNYWKNDGWYTVMISTDNQVEKALGLFDEAKEIANLK